MSSVQRLRGDPGTPAGRAVCYRCFKAEVVCVCADVPRVANRTEVIILQHPRERHHPIGTARFAALGLARSRLLECGPKDPLTLGKTRDLPPGTALLYPGPDSRDLESLSEAEKPAHLVVLDGTWHHAKRIFGAAPWLQALPRVQLHPSTPGAYRIRKEPRPECLSTIEAIVMALRALEPDTAGLAELLTAFDRMVDRQIAFRDGRGNHRHRTPRPRRLQFPPLLRSDRGDLVLAFADVVPTANERSTRLAYVAGLRLGSGERFEHYLRPDADVADSDLAPTGLDLELLRAGGDREGLSATWAEFLRPTDVLVSWNAATLRLLGGAQPRVLLKAAYCNLVGGKCGHIEEVLRRHDLATVPVAFPGRAGARLGNAAAVLEWLRGCATGRVSVPPEVR